MSEPHMVNLDFGARICTNCPRSLPTKITVEFTHNKASYIIQYVCPCGAIYSMSVYDLVPGWFEWTFERMAEVERDGA